MSSESNQRQTLIFQEAVREVKHLPFFWGWGFVGDQTCSDLFIVVRHYFYSFYGFHVDAVCFHGYLRAGEERIVIFQVKPSQSFLVLLKLCHFS